MWQGANWHFEELPATHVEQELTQRDQFNNDDVALADALVREVIQNSMDAGIGADPVKVRFLIQSVDRADMDLLRELVAGLREHLAACDLDTEILNSETARILCIEDFNTKGLTGDPSARDNQDFHNFWRRHGRSTKTGRAGGRWGLGKLVFSSSSKVRSFFGLTIRQDETDPLLMGQAVLSNHFIRETQRVAHGFWFKDRGRGQIQLPIVGGPAVSAFVRLAKLSRTNQSGLSIVIPFVNDDVSEESIVRSVIRNYYFPILASRVVIEAGVTTINNSTFHAVATSMAADLGGHAIPIEFVEKVSQRLRSHPDCFAETTLDSKPLDETAFSDEMLLKLRERYAAGDVLHVRVPVKFKPRSGSDRKSFIDLFLQSPPSNAKPFALFARGGITVPAEAKFFAGGHSYGAMVATDDTAVAFLGDAENPAHTAWNATAEKLRARWRSPDQPLRNIRHSLRALDSIISSRIESMDPDALLEFFSIDDPGRGTSGSDRRTPAGPVEILGRKKALIIQGRNGGFTLTPGPGVEDWVLPKYVDVRVAYDMIGSNPFKRHSAYDFDLTKNSIDLSYENMTVTPLKPNKLRLRIEARDFKLSGSGFDENRDLVIDARVVS